MAMFENQARRNVEMFEQAMKMFTPPSIMSAGASAGDPHQKNEKPKREDPEPESKAPEEDERDAAVSALKAQMKMMQEQLESLSSKK